jgi:hypothetical protein
MLHCCDKHDCQVLWDSEDDPAECPICVLIEDRCCELDSLREKMADLVAKYGMQRQMLQAVKSRAMDAEQRIEAMLLKLTRACPGEKECGHE